MSFCFRNQRENLWYLLRQLLFLFAIAVLLPLLISFSFTQFPVKINQRTIQEREEGLCDTASLFFISLLFFCVVPCFVFLHKHNQPPYSFYFLTPFFSQSISKEDGCANSPPFIFLSPLCFVSANKTQQQDLPLFLLLHHLFLRWLFFFVGLRATNTHEEAIQLP